MEGDPSQQGRPEQGERLRINGIVVPADENLSLGQQEIRAARLPDYQRVVGGLIERVGFAQPPGSMYVNEEGKMNGLPQNRRATLLLWMHNPGFRYGDVIAGDALIVGSADADGYDMDAPEELLQMLFEAKRFRPEVKVNDELTWHGNSRRFDNWVDAYAYVLALGWRWTSVADVRVVPED